MARSLRRPPHYMTLGDAAAHLGMSGDGGRRLRRQLLARERVTGRSILVRTHIGARSTYRVTLPLLREHCPEMFDRRDAIAEELREQIGILRDADEELWRRDEATNKTVRERFAASETQAAVLRAQVEALAKCVRELQAAQNKALGSLHVVRAA